MIIYRFTRGDSPLLRFHLYEDVTDEETDQVDTIDFNLEGAEVWIRLVPRSQGVREINSTMQILDEDTGLIAYQVLESYLPGEPPPLTVPLGSFGQVATYGGEIRVRTHPPDGSTGETLTAEKFLVFIDPPA